MSCLRLFMIGRLPIFKKLSEGKSGELLTALESMNGKLPQPKFYSVLNPIQRGGANFAEWLNDKGVSSFG